MTKVVIRLKGGPGSGHKGHRGRPDSATSPISTFNPNESDRDRRIRNYNDAVTTETGRRRLARLREGVIQHMKWMGAEYNADKRKTEFKKLFFADMEDLGDINEAFGLSRGNKEDIQEWNFIYDLESLRGK